MSKILLTEEGLRNLLSEQKEINEVKLPEVVKAIGIARAEGDLSENADYDASRNQQAELNHRLLEITNILKRAQVIKEASKDIVEIGSTVTFKYLEIDKEFTMQIVSTYETNPSNNKISDVSPLGKSLLGNKMNDVIQVKNNTVQILAIH